MTQGSLQVALQVLPKSRVCLCDVKGVATVAQMLAGADRLRAQVADLKGKRVALYGLSGREFVLALLALDGYAEQILLLPASLDKDTARALCLKADTTEVLTPDRLDYYRNSALPAERLDTSTFQTQWLMATSGTTGAPKLIAHRYATLTRALRVDVKRGKEFIWGQLYELGRFAGVQVMLQALVSGSAIVLPSYLELRDQIELFLKYGVNALSATPTMWRKLLMDGQVSRLPLKQITLGGETVDQRVIDALKHRFPNSRITHIYASTEAGAAFAVQDGRSGFPAEWLNNSRRVPALKISPSQHLLVKSCQIPSGDEINARIDSAGYLDTQDVVRVEGDRVYFMGRASGVINVGGNKVNPEWVESYIQTIDGVADVKVYPKLSSITGNLVAADIVADKGTDAAELRKTILGQCKSSLNSWEVPALIKFVSHLEANPTGKKDRQ